MKIGQAMIAEVTSCSPQETLQVAGERLRAHACGTLPVVDGRRRVVGILTDRDICIAATARDQPLSQLRVADAMTRDPSTCRAEDGLATAERLMRHGKVRRLPVVDRDGVLVGILSVDDLARESLRDGTRLDTRAVVETLVWTSHYQPLHRGASG